MIASMAPSTTRPNWLMIVASIYLVFGLPWVLAGLLFLADAAGLMREDVMPAVLDPVALLVAFIALLIGTLYWVIAWGLYRVREWASVNAIAIAILTWIILIGLAFWSPFASVVLAGLTLVKIIAEAAMIYYVGWKWPGTVNLGFVTSLPSAGAVATDAIDEATAPAAEPVSPGPNSGDGRDGGPAPTSPPGEPCPHSGCGYVGITRAMSACPKCGRPLPRRSDSSSQVQIVERPPAPVLGWVIVRAGPSSGSQFPLTTDIQVGRDPSCQVMLPDRYVSRRHARLRVENNRVFIYDLNTTGGTWVNDNRVQRRMLYDGDCIRMGQTLVEFHRAAS